MGTTLAWSPGVALRIGLFFAEFSGLEWDLRYAFDHLFDFKSDLSEAFFRPREGTSSRIDAMFRFSAELAPESPITECFREIEPSVKEIVRFRNFLAHGLIAGESENEAVLSLREKRLKLTSSHLDNEIAKMEELKRLLDVAWHKERDTKRL